MTYNGNSDSFRGLFNDYFEYAQGVNTGRSFPDVRDGFKPVHRRVLYALAQKGQRTLTKSSSVVGMTMEYHPHGDSSIYDALVLMTDKNGSWNVPLIKSAGSWGKVYSSEAKPSAPRYTESCLGEWADDFLKELRYTPYVPREMGEGVEPEVLPSRYPFMLTVGHSGMGVALATNIPPFNFWDVVALTKIYLEKGSWDDEYIFPDFPTGGSIVGNVHEALKLMYSGTAKMVVRATYDVDEKNSVIYVTEVPYGLSAEKMVEKIQALELEDVKSAVSNVDLNGCGVMILCKKGKVWDVERTLLKKSILQVNLSSQMVWTVGGEVVQGGVYRCVEEWVKFRKQVAGKMLTNEVEGLKIELETLGYFIKLVSSSSDRDAYIDKVVNGNKGMADAFLRELFEGIPADCIDWIYGRRLSAFNKSSAYKEKYDKLTKELEEKSYYLEHLEEWIIRDLEDLEKNHEGHHNRRTDISDVMVKFKASPSDNNVVDEPLKFSYDSSRGTVKVVPASAPASGDTVFMVSSLGCVVSITANGTAVKWWCSMMEKNREYTLEDWGIEGDWIVSCLDPSVDVWKLIYADGSAKVLDVRELVDGRKTKTKRNAIPSAHRLVSLIDPSKVNTVVFGYVYNGRAYVESIPVGGISSPKKVKISSGIPQYVGLDLLPPVELHEIGSKSCDKGVDFDNGLIEIEG